MKIVLPTELHPTPQEGIRERTLAFFTLLGWICAAYSWIKWTKNDVPEIAWGATLLISGGPVLLVLLKIFAIYFCIGLIENGLTHLRINVFVVLPTFC